jgi:hypothetical protein
MTEGLSKFLITCHQMPTEEGAEIADLTYGCGGPPRVRRQLVGPPGNHTVS